MYFLFLKPVKERVRKSANKVVFSLSVAGLVPPCLPMRATPQQVAAWTQLSTRHALYSACADFSD